MNERITDAFIGEIVKESGAFSRFFNRSAKKTNKGEKAKKQFFSRKNVAIGSALAGGAATYAAMKKNEKQF